MQGVSNGMNAVVGKPTLPAATVMGMVTLKVADLERSVAFYEGRIGLSVLQRDAQAATLGAGQRPLVRLVAGPGARPQPRGTTGLYHAAILFPDRQSLAIKIAQLSAAGMAIGQGDHLVSEAFYLADPDGNGLELYRDRPAAAWQWQAGQVRMATDPVDVAGMMAEIQDRPDALADPAAPEETRLGHMHLRVGDITLAEAFYVKTLGFDVTARWPGALFVSAGGYHHHLGLNTWQSRGGPPAPADSVGLAEFSLVLPNRDAIEAVLTRVRAAGSTVEDDGASVVLIDPFANRIRLVAA